MNTLLLFFALPIATIILAIVIEKILRCPILTAATFFAIYLVLAFAVFGTDFLIFVIIYTILAFITAVIAKIFFDRCKEGRNLCKWWCNCSKETNNNTITLSNQDIRRIAQQLANMQNNNNCNQNNTSNSNCINDVATVNVTNNTTGGRTSWCCYRR